MNNHDITLDQFAAWEVEAYLDGEEMPHIAEFLARNPAALAARCARTTPASEHSSVSASA